MARQRCAQSELAVLSPVLDRVNPPTPEEERELIRVAKDETLSQAERDRAARELVERNLRILLRDSKRRTRHQTMDLGDFLAAAVCGVYDAIRGFDPSKGARFVTYLGWHTYKILNVCQREEPTTIRIPKYLAGKQLPPGTHIPRVVQWDASPYFRGPFRRRDEEEHEGCESIEDPTPPEDRLEVEDEIKSLRIALSNLPARSRMILERRHGFRGRVETLQEIGDSLGVTRERVRQLEKKAVKLLRECFPGANDLEPERIAE